jgi:hypothetical protein
MNICYFNCCSLESMLCNLDIFPLGCCDERFCDHNNFPIIYSMYMCSQSPHSIVIKQLTKYKSCDIYFHGNMFPKFLTLTNYIFPTMLQFANGKHLSMQQETRPYISGFPSRPVQWKDWSWFQRTHKTSLT